MLEYLFTGALAISVPIASYLLIKRETSDEKIAEKVAALIENLANDGETQQKLFIIGGILGKGLIAGSGLTGLTGQRGGKLNFKDLVVSLIAQFAQNKFPQAFGQQEQGGEPPPQSSNTQKW